MNSLWWLALVPVAFVSAAIGLVVGLALTGHSYDSGYHHGWNEGWASCAKCMSTWRS